MAPLDKSRCNRCKMLLPESHRAHDKPRDDARLKPGSERPADGGFERTLPGATYMRWCLCLAGWRSHRGCVDSAEPLPSSRWTQCSVLFLLTCAAPVNKTNHSVC